MTEVGINGAARAPLAFRGVGIQGYSVGSVDVNSERLKYTSNDRSSSREVPWNRVEYATWAAYGRYCHLRLFMKSEGEGKVPEGPVRIDGFTKNNYGDLKDFMSSIGLELKNLTAYCGGGNYGKLDVTPNLITFSHDGRHSFDLDLGMISQCVLPGNNRKGNDVELQFHDSDAQALQDEDVLVEMRLYVAKGKQKKSEEQGEEGDEEEESVAWRNRGAAEEFQASVVSRANIGAVKGAVICEFDSTIGTFLTPRGRFALEMYGSFVRMHGPKYDYRIHYSDINRFYLLEKPDERYMAFIISLDKPIRQGQQRYQYLVMQSSRTLETVNINLSEEDIASKYGTQLQPVMEGSLCNTIAKVFKAMSGKSVFVASKFRSSEGAKCVSCALGASDGQLYPLNKSLVFIHKPTRVIAFEDIEYVEFQRYLGDKMAGSARRSFDLYVSLKSRHDTNEMGGSKDFTFSGIDRSEYTYLYEWLNGKEVRIENIKQKDDTLQKSALSEALADIEESSSDDENGMEGEESEEDHDYAPVSEDSSGEGSGSSSGDESSSSDRNEEKHKKRQVEIEKPVASDAKKVKKGKSSTETKRERGGEEAAVGREKKRKKRKDPNAPKGPLSAFMLYSIEERVQLKEKSPNLGFGEYGKIIGASWKELSEEKKSKWVAEAEKDKQRYKAEKLAYDSKKTDVDIERGNSPSKVPSHGGSDHVDREYNESE